MASLTQEMNEWWDEKETSLSQTSMSLSTKDLPPLSAIHTSHGLSNGTGISTRGRCSNSTSISTTISHPINLANESFNEEKSSNSTTSKPQPMSRSSHQNINISKYIIYDDKKFTIFNKTYTNCSPQEKDTKSLLSAPVITRISNANDKRLPLCYKETIVSSRKELKRCVDEYKALRLFCTACHGSDMANQYTALYINKKKGSTSYPKKVRLIMKFHEGEDLDDWLVDDDDGEVGFVYEDDFRVIMKKILYQLSICHTLGIIHCDLKPQNIRINELSDKHEEDHPDYYEINIIDFGFSSILSDDKKFVKMPYIKGTPGFIAPETIKNKKYSRKSDMFGVGCVAFFLLTNKYAVSQSPDMFQEDMMPDRKRIKRLLQRENDLNRDEESRIAPQTIDFVMSCLWKNPSKRPSVTQALKLKMFE